MPTYDYQCKRCKHEFEEFQSITADPLTKCPECGRNVLQRLIGPGAGLIFKGSGFYITDYKTAKPKSGSDSGKPGSDSQKPSSPAKEPAVASSARSSKSSNDD